MACCFCTFYYCGKTQITLSSIFKHTVRVGLSALTLLCDQNYSTIPN